MVREIELGAVAMKCADGEASTEIGEELLLDFGKAAFAEEIVNEFELGRGEMREFGRRLEWAGTLAFWSGGLWAVWRGGVGIGGVRIAGVLSFADGLKQGPGAYASSFYEQRSVDKVAMK